MLAYGYRIILSQLMAKQPSVNIEAEIKPLSRIEQFQSRLSSGELKGVADWAMEFFDHDTLEYKTKIRQMMSALRRKGIMVFTIPTGKEGEPAIVKIVTRNFTDFVAAYNRHAGQTVEPNILANFRIAERLVQEHPKAREMAVARAKQLIEAATNANKTLLSLPYGKSPNILGGGKVETR